MARKPSPNTLVSQDQQQDSPLAPNSLAMQLGSLGEVAPELTAPQISQPWLGFYSRRSERSDEITAALGVIDEGTPYVALSDDTYLNASGFLFLILRELAYWARLEQGTWETKDVQFHAPEQRYGGELKENILSVALLVPSDAAPIPAEHGPCLATVTTWRSTKTPAVKQHLAAIARSETPAWAKQGANGAIAASVPPRYRIASELRVEPTTARSGFTYHKARAIPRTVGAAQLQALGAWSKDEESQLLLTEAVEEFEARKAELESKVG